MIYGVRDTLIGCVLVLGVSLILGVFAGLIAGYYRGNVERVSDFISDSIMTLPGIVFLIALYAAIGPNLPVAMMVFGVIIAPTFFRLVRAVVVTVRHELFVDAAKVVGLSDLRIVGRHVLWAVRGPVVIHSAGILAAGIGIQAGLSFIGLGDPAVPSWGRILAEAFQDIYRNPTGVIFPSVVISVSILAFVLLGNVLRDVLQAAGSAHALRPARRRALVRQAQESAPTETTAAQDVVQGRHMIRARRFCTRQMQGVSRAQGARGVEHQLGCGVRGEPERPIVVAGIAAEAARQSTAPKRVRGSRPSDRFSMIDRFGISSSSW